MNGFSTDDFNNASHYFDQAQDYPWVIDNTDPPTFPSDDSVALSLSSNDRQDITSNVSNNPYNPSINVLPGHGLYGDGTIDLFDQSTGTNQVLL